MLLRMAFATFRWLTGLRPVWCDDLIRPVGDINSDIIEKFYHLTLVLCIVRFYLLCSATIGYKM